MSASAMLFLAQVGCRDDELKPQEINWPDAVGQDNYGRNYDQYKTAEALIDAWMPPQGSPYIPFFKQTLLASVDEMRTGFITKHSVARAVFTPDDRVAVNQGQNFARTGIPEHAAIFLDIEGEQAIVWGAVLAQTKGFQPVFTFNNWPHQKGIVPSERVLGTAIYYASTIESLKQEGKIKPASPPVFLLDSERLSLNAKADHGVYDNRYYLSPADLPSADQFKAAGVEHIIYVTAFGTRSPEQVKEQDDLNEYFTGLANAGLDFAIVAQEAFQQELAKPEYVGHGGSFDEPSDRRTPAPGGTVNPWFYYWLGTHMGSSYPGTVYRPALRDTFFHGGNYTGPGGIFLRNSSGGFGGARGIGGGGGGG